MLAVRGFEPVVLVVTVRLPVVAVQFTEKLVVALKPVRVTVCGLELLRLQFDATPLSWTAWTPRSTPLNVVLPLVGTDWLCSRSRVAVYPFGSRSEPVVGADTLMLPVRGGSRSAEGFGEAGLSQPSAHPTTIGTTYWRSVLRARMTRAPHGGTACALAHISDLRHTRPSWGGTEGEPGSVPTAGAASVQRRRYGCCDRWA